MSHARGKRRRVEILFVALLLIAGLAVSIFLLRLPAPDGLGPAVGSAPAK